MDDMSLTMERKKINVFGLLLRIKFQNDRKKTQLPVVYLLL